MEGRVEAFGVPRSQLDDQRSVLLSNGRKRVHQKNNHRVLEDCKSFVKKLKRLKKSAKFNIQVHTPSHHIRGIDTVRRSEEKRGHGHLRKRGQ